MESETLIFYPLVKTVLSCFQVYWTAVFFMNIASLKKMESMMCHFLWSGPELLKKMHAVRWELVCRPKTFPVRSLKDWNTASQARLFWEVASGKNDLWGSDLEERRM
jgi:hypothetical protein